MKKTTLTEMAIYAAFLFIAIFSFTFDVSGQQVVKDAAGNYRQISARNDSTKTGAKDTGKTFTDNKGNSYPVMISKNGKLFVIRTSKTGNRYNYYLSVKL